MRLDSLSPRTRSLVRVAWIVVVGGLWFVVLPAGAERMNRAALVVAGVALLLWCSGLFARVGKGSIVPIDAPLRLVATGLYRHSRNPIYIAYVSILLGAFLVKGHLALLLDAVLFASLLQAFVVFWEEPHLAQQFTGQWQEYAERVPRWVRLASPRREASSTRAAAWVRSSSPRSPSTSS